ncbi:MAG TPA: extracellular solute-binding protein [Jiangellaceae bacterium]|nr:extracellular solute-binding protein [Jiangellaceae bacterium]
MSIVLALALVLAACSGDDGSSDAVDESAGAGAELSGDLTVWFMDPGNPEAQETIDAAGAAFEAQHEGVTIDIEYLPWPGAHDRFVTGIAGGQVPDLAEMSTTWTPEFGEQGAFSPVEAPEGVEYVDALVEAGTVDGTSYGYPWYAGARALIYRTDVFVQAGVEPPTTWDEILSVGDTIAATVPDIAPMHVAGTDVHMLAPLVWGAGGEIATQEGDTWRAGVDSEAGRQAFRFFETLWKKGWTPEAAVQWNSVDLRDAFANGQSAMMVGGGLDLSAVLAANPDLEGKVGAALMPAGPAGSQDAYAGGSHLVVFQESDQQELANAFARYMIAPEQVTSFTEQIGFLPGTLAGVDEAVGDDGLASVFGRQLVEHSRSYPAAGWWGEVEDALVFATGAQKLMQGEITAEEAAAQTNAAIQEAVA